MSKTLALGMLTLLVAVQAASATTYIVVFEGSESAEGFEIGGNNLLNLNAALGAVTAAGGVVTSDMTQQMGVAIVSSANTLFASALRANPLVEEVGRDFYFRGFEGPAGTILSSPATAAESSANDPFEPQQWGMRMIRAPEARSIQSGHPAVDVAVIDTGIDAAHQDFFLGAQSNIDVARARSFVPSSPTALVDSPSPIFHGTAVAGLIGARRNGRGIVGVAPNVTLVPIKVCHDGCLFSSVLNAISYAAEIRADVINMSFFIDKPSEDGQVPPLTFFCESDPDDRYVRSSIERAIRFARKRGAIPVAAAGNDSLDKGADEDCEMLPQETPGVVAVGALGVDGTLASYSSYGLGFLDLVTPGGGGATNFSDESVCEASPLGNFITTYAGNSYICWEGTSFAAPMASGIAALIISEHGTLGYDGDFEMPVELVENILVGSAIDIGIAGEDMCYGAGRADALRAVSRDPRYLRDETVPDCMRSQAIANSCPGPQISDATGDTLGWDNLDIRSATFTADIAGNLQITLEIKDLSVPPPPVDVPGGLWAVFFDFNGKRYTVQAYGGAGSEATLRYTAGPFTGADEDGGPDGDVSPFNPAVNPEITGSFNPGPNGTIVFTVPRSLVGDPLPGDHLTNLLAVTYRATPVSVSPPADFAPNSGSGADYTVGEVCDPSAP